MRRLTLALALTLSMMGCPKNVLDSESWIEHVPEQGILFELADSGQQPRTELRYSPNPGDTSTVEMSIELEMRMDINGMSLPIPALPKIIAELDVTVQELLSSGDIIYTSLIRDYRLNTDDPTYAPLQETLSAMSGVTGRTIMSSRGEILDVSFTVPEGYPAEAASQLDSLSSSFESLSSPLPEQAVGVGARWFTAGNTESSGFSVKQRAEVELAEIEGNRITIKSTITQNIDSTESSIPGLPPNVEIKSLEFTSSGGGESVIDLQSMLPIQAGVFMAIDALIETVQGDEEATIRMLMDMNVGLKVID